MEMMILARVLCTAQSNSIRVHLLVRSYIIQPSRKVTTETILYALGQTINLKKRAISHLQAKDAGREDLPSVTVQDTMSKRSARSLSAGTEQVRPTTALVALGEIDEVDDFVLLPGGGNSRAVGETSASLRSKFAAAEQRGGSIGGSGDEDVLGPAGSLRSVNMSASRSASIRSSFLGSHFRRESIRALTDAQGRGADRRSAWSPGGTPVGRGVSQRGLPPPPFLPPLFFCCPWHLGTQRPDAGRRTISTRGGGRLGKGSSGNGRC